MFEIVDGRTDVGVTGILLANDQFALILGLNCMCKGKLCVYMLC